MSKAPFPRPILFVAGAVILLSIVTAAVGRLTGAANSTPTAPAVASRELLFRDQPNGAVAVYDARNTKVPIEMIAPATNGFLRATVRGLAQQRLRQDASVSVPFRLTEWADGRLTLADPTTGRAVEMEAFGITNESVFAELLTAQAKS
ncbi:photosynthetic complex assembly protein PuhC [Rhodopila sp.]|uniref:photosynthetic complex assembly protein PuhC n=1 Tax=Rhodopila sp. TaxID=2480087 RepID=UPI003D09B6A7